MSKKWRLHKSKDKGSLNQIFDDIADAILRNRGYSKEEDIEAIIHPRYDKHLHDPFLLKDMKKATSRILKAIKKKERILIFGDYDADGVPATALMTDFLDKINFSNYLVYIPDRHTEQYGMSLSVIDKFKGEKVDLIVTVDCGVSNYDEVKKANKLGIDVVVTDHHLPPEKLPQAKAVIDPQRDDCHYPYKNLSGTGVAFKLVQALIKEGEFKEISADWEKGLLDLVAIATVADMVPITGENKVLVKFGLIILRMTKRIGLIELFRAIRLKQKYIDEDDIGFMIGPRINSAGRMAHALEAYKLLKTRDELEAKKIVYDLEKNNKARKSIVAEILEAVESQYKTNDLPDVIVVGREDWGLGVLGLAASRLSENLNKTVFVWAKNGNGEIKGSCRSCGDVNAVLLMTEAGGKDFFSDFGGHEAAGGFSLSVEKLDQLSDQLNKAYKNISKNVDEIEKVADIKLSLDDINWRSYDQIESLAPYGMDFLKPVFWFEKVKILAVKSFGKENNHIEITFDNKGFSVMAIAFFACQPSPKASGTGRRVCEPSFTSCEGHIWPGVDLTPGKTVDMLASIEKSTFRYKPELRLRIVDLKVI